MDVHGTADRRVGQAGGHRIDDAVDRLVGLDAEERRTEELLRPCVSERSRARPTRVIIILPKSAGRPDARTSRSVRPARASGGSVNSA